jgi:DNA-binding phage protein
MIGGEVDLAKILLRDYINASIGFAELGRLTRKSPKSLMRMFSPAGNPQARNLFEIIALLQVHEGVRLAVRIEKPLAA